MNEEKARITSLIIAGTELLAVFAASVFFFFRLEGSLLKSGFYKPDSTLIIIFSLFAAIGILLVLSVFFKPAYYVLAAAVVALLFVFRTFGFKFFPATPIILSPYLLYYGILIYAKCTKKDSKLKN